MGDHFKALQLDQAEVWFLLSTSAVMGSLEFAFVRIFARERISHSTFRRGFSSTRLNVSHQRCWVPGEEEDDEASRGGEEHTEEETALEQRREATRALRGVVGQEEARCASEAAW